MSGRASRRVRTLRALGLLVVWLPFLGALSGRRGDQATALTDEEALEKEKPGATAAPLVIPGPFDLPIDRNLFEKRPAQNRIVDTAGLLLNQAVGLFQGFPGPIFLPQGLPDLAGSPPDFLFRRIAAVAHGR